MQGEKTESKEKGQVSFPPVSEEQTDNSNHELRVIKEKQFNMELGQGHLVS